MEHDEKRPATPRRIALVDSAACAHGARDRPTASGLLLDDFADALIAYDRISARALGVEGESEPPELARLDAGGWSAAAARGRLDALVIGIDADRGQRDPDPVVDLLDAVAASGGDRPLLAYAIACTDRLEESSAETVLEPLRGRLDGAGIPWGGGVVALGARTVPDSAGQPRMGMARRSRSEAIDHLISAVRSGRSVPEADRLFAQAARATGGGSPDVRERETIVSKCPLPRALYRLLYR